MAKLKSITILAGTYDRAVMEVKSSSSDAVYRVDTVNGRCSCPAWKFSRNGVRKCKHLEALGIKSFQGGALVTVRKDF